jgi:hypothetical protein
VIYGKGKTFFSPVTVTADTFAGININNGITKNENLIILLIFIVPPKNIR